MDCQIQPSGTMSAKLVLNVEAMQENFFADTALIGIVSLVPAYRFAWLLNECLDLNFVRDAESDVCVHKKNKEPLYFSIYRYDSITTGNRFMLYKLKMEEETLLPEVKQMDYLWMVQSHATEDDAKRLARHLKSIPEVQMAKVIMPDMLKNINNLLV